MPDTSTSTSNSHQGWLIASVFCAFLALTALMIAAGSGQAQTTTSLPKVHDAEVIKATVQHSYQQQRSAYGRIETTKKAQAGFELAGTVLEILVDEGDSIKAGDILARLDTQRLAARLQELDAALARAQADARLANLSEQRVAELVRKKLESAQRLDESREATAAAEALVAEIKARKNSLAVELGKSVLRAPFSANVVARPVDPGTVVAAGQTILELQQTSGLEVRIALPADDAFNFRVGDIHQLINDSQAHDSQKISAKIKSIAKQRKLNTRTVDVILTLMSDGASLLPGDLLALNYTVSINESGMWVPKQALNSGVRGLWTLFTVQGTGPQPIIAKAVEVLHFDTTRAFVRGAVSSSDYIVISGTQRFVPDQLVKARLSIPPVALIGE